MMNHLSRPNQRLVYQVYQLSISTNCRIGCLATQMNHGKHKLPTSSYFKPKIAHVHNSAALSIPRGRNAYQGSSTTVRLPGSSDEVENYNSVENHTSAVFKDTEDSGLTGTYIVGKKDRTVDKYRNDDNGLAPPQRHPQDFTDDSYRQQKDEIRQDLAAASFWKFAGRLYNDGSREGSWTKEGRSDRRTDKQGYDGGFHGKGQKSNGRDQKSEKQMGNRRNLDDGWFNNGKDGGKKSSKHLRRQVPLPSESPVDVRITSPKVSDAFPSSETRVKMADDDRGTSGKVNGNDGWQNEQRQSDKLYKEKRNKSERKKTKDDKKSKRAAAYLPNPDNDILFGIAPCWLALQQNRRILYQAFVSPSFQASDRHEACGILKALEGKVKLEVVHTDVLDKLSGGRPHQGVCIETSSLEHFTLSDREEVLSSQVKALLPNHQHTSPPLWLALDQVKDPMNFGAVLRSSYFFGVDRVITCTQNSCPLSPVVSKASSGVMEIYDVYAAMDMVAFLQCMTVSGWQVIGATSSSGAQSRDCVPCEEFTITKPTVVVIGNEGIGLRPEIESKCSKFVTIQPGRELHSGMDSLNVSVATGVLLHALMRRSPKET